jgi:hypothetical protein
MDSGALYDDLARLVFIGSRQVDAQYAVGKGRFYFLDIDLIRQLNRTAELAIAAFLAVVLTPLGRLAGFTGQSQRIPNHIDVDVPGCTPGTSAVTFKPSLFDQMFIAGKPAAWRKRLGVAVSYRRFICCCRRSISRQ